MKRKADAPKTRKGYSKRSRSSNYVASVARSEARKEVRKNQDWLFTDVSGSGGVSSSGTIVNLLNSANRGLNGLNGYSGNTINPAGLRLKYYWSTDQVHNSVRVLLFQWFDATVPVLSGILQSITTGQATISPMSTTNLQYIKVLYDGHHMLAPTAADGGSVLGSGTASCPPLTPYDEVHILLYCSISPSLVSNLTAIDVELSVPLNIFTHISCSGVIS